MHLWNRQARQQENWETRQKWNRHCSSEVESELPVRKTRCAAPACRSALRGDVAGGRLPVAGGRLQVAGCRWQVAGGRCSGLRASAGRARASLTPAGRAAELSAVALRLPCLRAATARMHGASALCMQGPRGNVRVILTKVLRPHTQRHTSQAGGPTNRRGCGVPHSAPPLIAEPAPAGKKKPPRWRGPLRGARWISAWPRGPGWPRSCALPPQACRPARASGR